MLKLSRSVDELVAEAEETVISLTPTEVLDRLDEPGLLLIDLRDIRELKRDGRIPGSVHVPRGMLEFKIEDEVDDKDARLVTYCAAGSRSALAAATLKTMGYVGAISSDAGFNDLVKVGLPIADDNE